MKLLDLPPEIQQEVIEMQQLARLGPEGHFASLDHLVQGDFLSILRGIKLWMQVQRQHKATNHRSRSGKSQEAR